MHSLDLMHQGYGYLQGMSMLGPPSAHTGMQNVGLIRVNPILHGGTLCPQPGEIEIVKKLLEIGYWPSLTFSLNMFSRG